MIPNGLEVTSRHTLWPRHISLAGPGRQLKRWKRLGGRPMHGVGKLHASPLRCITTSPGGMFDS